ncbi:MAG: hypothetical protein Pg6C_16430 [Treponemataceae bacterium]|nr:MAG: hypothetical protein Pg6C_16430 [Treponemataceae bacterium]
MLRLLAVLTALMAVPQEHDGKLSAVRFKQERREFGMKTPAANKIRKKYRCYWAVLFTKKA